MGVVEQVPACPESDDEIERCGTRGLFAGSSSREGVSDALRDNEGFLGDSTATKDATPPAKNFWVFLF